MTDEQLIKQAQNPNLYNTRFIDVASAFNKGLMIATKGSPTSSSNPVASVKNHYESKLNGYLNNLPAGADLTQISDKYKGAISSWLHGQKHDYVAYARELSSTQTGSDRYLDLQMKMNDIKNSLTNLNKNVTNFGQLKEKFHDDVKNKRISNFTSNEANVNLLASVFSDEFDMAIDKSGNPSFVADDGTLAMEKIPGYELKARKAASAMLKMNETAYNLGAKGIEFTSGHPTHDMAKSNLSNTIDEGGPSTLLSIISDDLVGDIRMINDPFIAQNVVAYQNGALSFKGLKDIVVDNYMEVLKNSSGVALKSYKDKAAKANYKDVEGEFGKKVDLVRLQDGMYYSYPSRLGNPPKLVKIKGSGVSDGGGGNNNTNSVTPAELQKEMAKLKKEFPGMSPEYYKEEAMKMLQ